MAFNSVSKLYLTLAIAAVVFFSTGSVRAQELPVWNGGEIVPKLWHVLGPFHSGSRESGTDPLFYFDGKRLKIPPDFRRTYPSIFGHGGRVGWVKITPSENGTVEIAFENPPEKDWEMREDEWGAAGVSFRGIAYSEIEMPFSCRALISAQSVGGFQINGRDYMGDAYGHNLWLTPVVLNEGVNRITVGISGWVGKRTITFKVLPIPNEPVGLIEEDLLVPDVLQGEPLDAWAGIPLVNYSNEWQRGYSITIGGVDGIAKSTAIVPDIQPLGVLKVPVQVRSDAQFLGKQFNESEIALPLKISAGDFIKEHQVKLRVREAGETYRCTFISKIDGGVQKFSVRPPLNYDESKSYSLILSLHGAGVDSDGQVGAYASYDWTFIVAPTNRRPYGFDWQDWGRMDAIEVLEIALERFPIDRNRVILSGHSMGGHGTWHVGSTHPDKFAAMIPIAGWTSFQYYVPFLLRQSEIFSPPEVNRILDMCSATDRTELLLENLINTPVLAVHGTIDDNVPATHPRLLIGTLEKMGYSAKIIEQPEAGHWWDFNVERPGTDAVDAEEIIAFAKDKVRVESPDEVSFVGYDLANENRQYWVRVLSQEKLYGRTAVYGRIIGSDITLRTLNVGALRLDLPAAFWEETIKLIIDGVFLPVRVQKRGVELLKTEEGWNVVDQMPAIQKKYAGVSGPIKRAYFSPFILVDASDGLEPAAMECITNEAARWWYRGNGFCNIKRLADLTDDEKRNFNLVFYGTFGMLPREFTSALPVSFGTNGVTIGGRFVDGRDLFAKFVYASPYNSEKLVLVNTGLTENALKASEKLNALYSGSTLPDYVIASEGGIARYGLAGARAIGFFDADWNFDAALAYIAPERK